MATIQIRDIPEDAYETLRHRARAEGKSLQSYMRDQIVEQARRRTRAEVMAELEEALARDPRPGVTAQDVIADLDEARR